MLTRALHYFVDVLFYKLLREHHMSQHPTGNSIYEFVASITSFRGSGALCEAVELPNFVETSRQGCISLLLSGQPASHEIGEKFTNVLWYTSYPSSNALELENRDGRVPTLHYNTKLSHCLVGSVVQASLGTRTAFIKLLHVCSVKSWSSNDTCTLHAEKKEFQCITTSVIHIFFGYF